MLVTRSDIDVEDLLRWAYRDELPKGYRGDSLASPGWASISPMFRSAALGTSVDWSREPGLPMAMGDEPHPDAILAESAVGRLEDVGLDWAASREPLMGHLAPYVDLNDPALTYLSFQAGALVAMHARMGTRPQWDLGEPKLLRINSKNNKARVQFLDDDGVTLIDGLTAGRRYGPGARCPLRLEPLGAEIAFARAEYAAWRAGLCRVTMILENWDLRDHRARPPRAAAEPWAYDDEPKTRILRAQVQSANLKPARRELALADT